MSSEKNILDKYFEILHTMKSIKSKNMSEEDLLKYFNAGEECLSILPQVVKAFHREFGKKSVSNGLPPSIPCRDELPEMYMRYGRWGDALRVIENTCKAGAMVKADEKEMFLWVEGCKSAAYVAIEYIDKNPGAIQKDIYKELPRVDTDYLKWFLRASRQVEKVKFGNTNKLYLYGQKPADVVPVEPKPHALVAAAKDKTIPVQEIKFPNWYVSVSFGRSTSQVFPQAVALAKMAPQYIEQMIEGQILHQAVYSEKFDEYLQFIKLYELVQNWKSCFVIINGQMVDRKIIGGLNYCYGDKCRSGNPNFCYGASMFTENPFGCHRIQTSAWNHPWWSFGIFDTSGIWHLDKGAILERMTEYSQPYRLCPTFSWEKALDGLEQLPDTINPKKDKEWTCVGNSISPNSRMEPIASLNINIGQENVYKNPRLTAKQGHGCATMLLNIIIITLYIMLLIKSIG